MNPPESPGTADELEDCLGQVYRMALAAAQSYVFWRYTCPDENPHEATLKKFGHFFYATNEAHLTMMIVSLDCLYDEKPKLINFSKLLVLIKPMLAPDVCEFLEKRIEKLHKSAKGLGIIRNNSFAHLAERQTRTKIGEKYALNHAQYLTLCYESLDVVTTISNQLGTSRPGAKEVSLKDVDQIQALFSELERPQLCQAAGNPQKHEG